MTGSEPPRVWYVAYGSNLAMDRFRCYLRGGRVPGGERDYPGCRDPRDPAASTALHLPGGLVFAGRSTVWGGGMAVYDPRSHGRVACRGYLITVAQLADVVAQEVRQPPGGCLAHDLTERLAGLVDSMPTAAPGMYDTVVRLGRHDAAPMYTVTHAEVALLTPAAPTAPYLSWIAAGLREAHGWEADRIGRYLGDAPGIAGTWAPADLTALVAAGDR
jgi:hypothetical protein